MTQRFDLAIVGGGPAGSAAAWRASQTGASVVVLDKAEFPRDKPCGDGLTARAVSYLQKMGLAEEVSKFHRVDGVRVFSPSEWDLSFPRRPGMPDHGYVARRPELDTILLRHAASVGAVVREGAEVIGPVLDAARPGHRRDTQERRDRARRCRDCGRRRLLAAEAGDEVGLGVQRLFGHRDPCGDACQSSRLEHAGDLPQAGLRRRSTAGLRLGVPVGGGQINIGLGYVNSYKKWQQINATQFMGEFMETLPREWEPPLDRRAQENPRCAGWRLPMGFTAWPPWRPGVLFTGDARRG